MPVELNQWLLQGLRATAFFAPSEGGGVRAEPDLDRVFTDVEVESKEVRKPLGETQQVGSLGVGKITLSTAPGRADFIWNVDHDDQPFEIATLGDIGTALAVFLQPVCGWLSEQNDVNRVAVGINARLPADSRDQAYAMVNELVPEIKVDPSSSGEVVFQINRWLDVDVDGSSMRCNRVSRWSSVYHAVNEVAVVGGIPQHGRKVSESFAVSSQLDFNSAADFVGAFKSADAVSVLQTLAKEAKETLINGQIKTQ